MNTKTSSRRILAAGIGLLLSAGCQNPHRYPGKPAPNFELSSLGGEKVSLAGQKGHVVLLSFWAVG